MIKRFLEKPWFKRINEAMESREESGGVGMTVRSWMGSSTGKWHINRGSTLYRFPGPNTQSCRLAWEDVSDWIVTVHISGSAVSIEGQASARKMATEREWRQK